MNRIKISTAANAVGAIFQIETLDQLNEILQSASITLNLIIGITGGIILLKERYKKLSENGDEPKK